MSRKGLYEHLIQHHSDWEEQGEKLHSKDFHLRTSPVEILLDVHKSYHTGDHWHWIKHK